MPYTGITTDQFLDAAKYRRSVYALKDKSSVSDARIEEIVQGVLSFSPSSYNSQPFRVTLVLGEKHAQFWDIVTEIGEPILKGFGEEVWKALEPKFQLFRRAYGSVIFWESGQTTKDMQEEHKAVASKIPQFGDHASGMIQILVWTALELEGLGGNLQHMSLLPPVEDAIKKFLDVPDHYVLKAHLNFGDEAQDHPAIPEKLPFSETLKIVK